MTLMDLPASVANKRLTVELDPLDATYRKQGEQGVMVNDHPPDIEVWTLRPSDFRFHPLLCELCVPCALCAKSFFVFELSTVNLFILPQQIGFPPPHPIKSPLCPLSERKRTRQDEATS